MPKRANYYILLLFLLPASLIAQKFNWVDNVSHSSNNKSITSLVSTGSHQVLVGANFSNSITIASSTFNSSGTKDNLVYVLSSSGNPVWSSPIHFKSTGSSDVINDSYFDGTSFYVSGQLDGIDTVVDGSTIPIESKYTTGNYFVSKISSSGFVDWVFPDTGSTYSLANSVTGDGQGNIYVVGQFFDSLEVDTTLYAGTLGDLFLLKIQTNPIDLKWARRINGPGKETAVEVLYDSTNKELVVIGNFEETISAGTFSISPSVTAKKDVFAARYDLGGSELSLTSIMSSSNDVEALSADITGSGNYVVSGRFNGAIASSSKSTNGGFDIFTAGFNSTSSRVWLNTYGGNAQDQGDQVVLSNSGTAYVFGTFKSGSFLFGTKTMTTSSTQDALLMAFSNTGVELGAKSGIMNFSPDLFYANALSHSADRLIIGTEYSGKATFGSQSFTSAGGVHDMATAQIVPTSVYCDISTSVAYSSNFSQNGSNQELCSNESGIISSMADTSYSFAWYELGSGISIGTKNDLTVSDSGDYFVVINDPNSNCVDTSTISVIKLKPLDSLSVVIDDQCINGSTFSISTFPSFVNFSSDSLFAKGVGFSIFNQYSPVAAGIGLDTVIFQKLGFNGCFARDTSIIEVHSLPVISISTSLIRAYCAQDEIDTLKFGSASNLFSQVYSLPGTAGGILNDSIFRCDSLPAGNYTVNYHVEDSNGCNSDTLLQNILVINSNPIVSLNPNQTVFCKNDPLISSLGGAVPNGGKWFGTGITDSISGSYNPGIPNSLSDTVVYSITNSNGCTGMDTSYIFIDSIPKLTFIFDDTICDGDAIHSLKASPNYTTADSASFFGHPALDPNSNYFYPTISGVGQFTIGYYFRDGNGCSDTASTVIEVRNLPNVSLPQLGTYCENEGAVDLRLGTPAGGDYFYKTFKLDSGYLKTDTNYVDLGNGTVYYEYTDSMNCMNKAFNFINIKQKPSLSLSQFFFDNLCDNDDEIQLTQLGLSEVSPPPSSGGFFSFDTNTEIDVFNPGLYSKISLMDRPALTYVYRDSLIGCNDTLGIYPNINSSPEVSIEHKGLACAGLDYELTAKGALLWRWSTGDSTASTYVTQDTATEYSVIGQRGICFDTTSVLIDITPGELLIAKNDSISLFKGEDVTVDPLARLYPQDTLNLIGSFKIYENPIEARTFDATDGIVTGLESNLYYEPNIEYRRQDSALYEICNVSCPNLCDSAKVLFHVMGNPYEFIPNLFTPNGDGVNDFWVVPGIEAFPESSLTIYNRWGDLIYEMAPYNNEWSGQTNAGIAGGKQVVDGTYFYVLKTEGGDPLKGTIEIKSR